MSDKELLELAAKAAGIEILDWYGERYCCRNIGEDGTLFNWNPIESDGDALRLAVKLNIDPMFNTFNDANDRGVSCTYPVPGNYLGLFEPYKDDPYAATRRAIVRAAAAIGKEMK